MRRPAAWIGVATATALLLAPVTGRAASPIKTPITTKTDGPAAPGATAAASAVFGMSVPTVVDPVRGAGEPYIGVDDDNNPLITGPAGSSTQTSWFWRSNDGGQTFTLQGPNGGHWLCASGGGDSEVLIDHVNHDIYLTDQMGLASLATGKLTGGKGDLTSKCLSTPAMSADRPFEALIHPTDVVQAPQYVENGGKPIVYLSWACQACAGGGAAGGLAFAWTVDGINWHAADPGVAADTLVTDQFQEASSPAGFQWHGTMVADQQTGYVFTALSCNVGNCGKNAYGLLVGKPGTPLTRTDATNQGQFASLTYQQVADKVNGATMPEPGALFPIVAMDSARTLYTAWIQGDAQAATGVAPPVTSWHLYYAYSKDQPNHSVWSQPIRVDAGSASLATVFPWMVAGDAGKLGFLWLGADKRVHPSKRDPSIKWHPFVAVTTNGDTAAPVFQQAQVGVNSSHLGDICVHGTTCGTDSPPGSRTMADFVSADIGRDGALEATYADDANSLAAVPTSQVAGLPVTMFAKQISGPKLVGTGDVGGGSTSLAVPTAELAGTLKPDRLGDGIYGTANVSQLDLAGYKIETAGSDIIVTVPVASLSSLASPEAAPGQSHVWWIVTWKYNNRIYFARAESDNGTSVAYTAGTPTSYDRPGIGYSTVPTLVDYRAGTAVTGDRVGNSFVIKVPASAVGSPKTGDTLESVTGFSMLDNGAPPVVAPGPGVIPRIVDATPASTIRLSVLAATAGAGCTPGTAGCSGAPTPATGGRARSGLALGVLFAALLLSRVPRRRSEPTTR